jgi:hypothetical protein
VSALAVEYIILLSASLEAILHYGILPLGADDGGKSLALSIKRVALTTQPAVSRRLNTMSLSAAASFCPHEGALLAAGLCKAAAKTAAPWMRLVGAANEEAPTSDPPPLVWATCSDGFERMSVSVDVADLEPHPAFVSAVENAMGAHGADTQVQLRALRRVLAVWGPVLATRVTLGCAYTTSTSWVLRQVKTSTFHVRV